MNRCSLSSGTVMQDANKVYTTICTFVRSHLCSFNVAWVFVIDSDA